MLWIVNRFHIYSLLLHSTDRTLTVIKALCTCYEEQRYGYYDKGLQLRENYDMSLLKHARIPVSSILAYLNNRGCWLVWQARVGYLGSIWHCFSLIWQC